MKSRILSFIASLLIVVMVSPSFILHSVHSEPAKEWTVPEGYNEHDYNLIVEFLEQVNENGVKNGLILNQDYDPNNPDSWGMIVNPWNTMPRFLWEQIDNEYRITEIRIGGMLVTLTGDLILSGCEKLIMIDCGYNSIDLIAVDGCTDLQYLYVWYTNISELDVSGNTELLFLYCDCCNLSSLNISGCINLEHLYCGNSILGDLPMGNNHISALDLSNNTNLQSLGCEHMPELNELNISSCESLFLLDCRDCGLTELDVSRNLQLQSLYCQQNNISFLDLTNNAALTDLDCSDNKLASLDVSDCNNLQNLWCNDNELVSLNYNDELKVLDCKNNFLTELQVGSLLIYLNCSNNHIDTLDISNNDNFSPDFIGAEHGGSVSYISYMPLNDEESIVGEVVCAFPNSGCEFLGWYNEEGELLSTDAEYVIAVTDYNLEDPTPAPVEETVYIARFSGGNEPLLGDVTGDGMVTSEDALIVMRSTLGLTELTAEQSEIADMNGDGIINLVDALLILRTAMGLN